ncbi:MAG TPA: thioredoxin domain-containing protein [Terriglobales bacterium]|nr:thioredoxin domain-containing protein [Terriglobales bacterium]
MTKYVNSFFWRICSAALLVCVGCAAQSSTPSNADLDRKVERQIRAHFSVPAQVGIDVTGRKPSTEFPAFDALTVTFSVGDKKQDQEFLISKDGKQLIRMSKIDLTKDPYAETMSKIDISGRPVRGNKNAKVTIVNYDDFQCPFCARMHDTLTQQVLKQYGDKVKVVYKDYPLVEIHPWAKRAAVDANCLGQLKESAYWDFADALHANARSISQKQGADAQRAEVDRLVMEEGKKAGVNTSELQACVSAQKEDKVLASMAEAEALGVSSTPTLFINGQKLEGAVPAQEVKSVIDRALADAGDTAPAAASQKTGNGGN